MKIFVPFRNKDAKRFANQLIWDVTEHGLDAVTSEIYMASLINDDYGIRIFLEEAMELGLAQHEMPLKLDPPEAERLRRSNVDRFPPVHECEEIKKQIATHLAVLRGDNNLAAKLRARMAATVLSMIRPATWIV